MLAVTVSRTRRYFIWGAILTARREKDTVKETASIETCSINYVFMTTRRPKMAPRKFLLFSFCYCLLRYLPVWPFYVTATSPIKSRNLPARWARYSNVLHLAVLALSVIGHKYCMSSEIHISLSLSLSLSFSPTYIQPRSDLEAYNERDILPTLVAIWVRRT